MKTTKEPHDYEVMAVADIYRALNKHVENLTPCQLLGVIESVKLGLSQASIMEFKKHEH